jgi:tetratricopeptide (TPR) repeat protein
MRRALALAAAALTASCAPRLAPPPRAPDGYVFPHALGAVADRDRAALDRAWRALLEGDHRGAERRFASLLGRRPGSVPAEAGLAYVRLAQGDTAAAADLFASVLARRADYVPARAGAAAAALGQGDLAAAVGHLKAAVALAPGHADLRRRLGELRLRLTEARVASAREAEGRGDPEAAAEWYRIAVAEAPEVAGLRLSLAELLARRGDLAGAREALAADPTEDRPNLLVLADLHRRAGDLPAALAVYRRLLSREPGDGEALALAREVAEQIELGQMPEEYRRISTAGAATRADLAALLVVKVTALERLPGGPPPVAVDVAGSWARDHILRVLELGILGVYPNHTFQPAATVRRGDLAGAVERVLDLLGQPAPPGLPSPVDMAPQNLYFSAARRAAAAGLMELTPEGAFEAWRPVPGAEAVSVVAALARLLGP